MRSISAGATSFSEGYLGDQFQQDNFTLDYSVFTVEGASDDYERAELDPRLPPVGERIYISGHPAGNPKKLTIEDDTSPNGLCRVDISPTDGRGTDTDIGYFCDTAPKREKTSRSSAIFSARRRFLPLANASATQVSTC